MKLNVIAAFAPFFATSVFTMPAPDPGNRQMVLSLEDDVNVEAQPLQTPTPSIAHEPTPGQVNIALYTSNVASAWSGWNPFLLDGKSVNVGKFFSTASTFNSVSPLPKLSACVLEFCTTYHHSLVLVLLTAIDIFS